MEHRLLAARADRMSLLGQRHPAGVAALPEAESEPRAIVERAHERLGHRPRLFGPPVLAAGRLDSAAEEGDQLSA